jgi:hypothetical protein
MDPDKVHKLAAQLERLPADKQQVLLAILARDGLDVRAMTRDQDVRYWTRQLAGLDPQILLPADRPRPAAPTYRRVREAIALPAALVAGARQLGEQHGATLHLTLLAASAAV